MKQKILVIDDDITLAAVVKEILGDRGFEVATANSGDEGIAMARDFKPDLILLDVMLPDFDGYTLCRVFRQGKNTANVPVIMLTAKDKTEEKIAGLRTGADDYISKPFNGDELAERIKSVLRRTYQRVSGGEEILKSGDLLVNVTRHAAKIKRKTIKLSPKEFELLCAFLRKKGWVYDKQFLLEQIWGYTSAVNTRTVEKHIEMLRKKLGLFGKKIQTVYGYGFAFIED
ncbi:MAG: response regulator transcription factor [Elusimicrobiota bacterium]